MNGPRKSRLIPARKGDADLASVCNSRRYKRVGPVAADHSLRLQSALHATAKEAPNSGDERKAGFCKPNPRLP